VFADLRLHHGASCGDWSILEACFAESQIRLLVLVVIGVMFWGNLGFVEWKCRARIPHRRQRASQPRCHRPLAPMRHPCATTHSLHTTSNLKAKYVASVIGSVFMVPCDECSSNAPHFSSRRPYLESRSAQQRSNWSNEYSRYWSWKERVGRERTYNFLCYPNGLGISVIL
jgi:hypothetical protein